MRQRPSSKSKIVPFTSTNQENGQRQCGDAVSSAQSRWYRCNNLSCPLKGERFEVGCQKATECAFCGSSDIVEEVLKTSRKPRWEEKGEKG